MLSFVHIPFLLIAAGLDLTIFFENETFDTIPVSTNLFAGSYSPLRKQPFGEKQQCYKVKWRKRNQGCTASTMTKNVPHQNNTSSKLLSVHKDARFKWCLITYISTVSETTTRIRSSYSLRLAHKPSSALHGQLMKLKKQPTIVIDKSKENYFGWGNQLHISLQNQRGINIGTWSHGYFTAYVDTKTDGGSRHKRPLRTI